MYKRHRRGRDQSEALWRSAGVQFHLKLLPSAHFTAVTLNEDKDPNQDAQRDQHVVNTKFNTAQFYCRDKIITPLET